MQTVVNGATLDYETHGDGPPVVFVHGLGGTSNVWHAQRLTLSRYFRVITFDLSGSGRSDKTRRSFAIPTWADELAALLDHLQIPAATVVGHSMGTLIAQHFAAKHPARTTALVLCGGLIELAAPSKEAFVKRAETVEREGMTAVADAILGGWLTAGTRDGNPALAGLVRELILSNDPACYAAQCRALAGSGRADLDRITCPTLLLVGDQDPTTPLAIQRQIASAIKNSRLRIVPDTAHLTMAESPGAFNAALLEFLATV